MVQLLDFLPSCICQNDNWHMIFCANLETYKPWQQCACPCLMSGQPYVFRFAGIYCWLLLPIVLFRTLHSSVLKFRNHNTSFSHICNWKISHFLLFCSAMYCFLDLQQLWLSGQRRRLTVIHFRVGFSCPNPHLTALQLLPTSLQCIPSTLSQLPWGTWELVLQTSIPSWLDSGRSGTNIQRHSKYRVGQCFHSEAATQSAVRRDLVVDHFAIIHARFQFHLQKCLIRLTVMHSEMHQQPLNHGCFGQLHTPTTVSNSGAWRPLNLLFNAKLKLRLEMCNHLQYYLSVAVEKWNFIYGDFKYQKL